MSERFPIYTRYRGREIPLGSLGEDGYKLEASTARTLMDLQASARPFGLASEPARFCDMGADFWREVRRHANRQIAFWTRVKERVRCLTRGKEAA